MQHISDADLIALGRRATERVQQKRRSEYYAVASTAALFSEDLPMVVYCANKAIRSAKGAAQ